MNKLEHLRGLEAHLKDRVIGQDDAVARVSRALEAAELGLNDTGPRPRASFLFMGPTGVGKTETTKVFTEYLFGGSRLAMVFCNQYQQANDAAEMALAVQRAVQAYPNGTTLLFDEFDKAHKAVIDVFLSLLDEGQVTLADGSRVSVAKCHVVMTSNIGSSRFSEMLHTPYTTMETFAFSEARKSLRPELFARLTETIVFRPLSQSVQEGILGGLVSRKLQHLESCFESVYTGGFPAPLTIDEKGVNAHLVRKGFTQTGGARRLREELNRQFNAACLPWLLSGQAPREGQFYADPKRDCLELR
jgi:ATP-dependent Clp protease ATP-binding subunit ClpA